MWNQHHHQQLLMKKRSIKLKKYGSIENKAEKHNIWCTGKVIGTSMTNRLQNQGCLIQERQLKTIRQGVRAETYKERE